MFVDESFVTAVYPNGTTTVNAVMARVLCDDPGKVRTIVAAAQAYRVSGAAEQWSVDASLILKNKNVQILEIPLRRGNNGQLIGTLDFYFHPVPASERPSLGFRSQSGKALGYDVYETEIPALNLDGSEFDQVDVYCRKVVSTSAVNISVIFGARVLIQ